MQTSAGIEVRRWIRNEATIQVAHVAGQGEGFYRLKLAVAAFQGQRHLQIYSGDRLLGEYAVKGETEVITPPFSLGGGERVFRFRVLEGCQKPFNLLRGYLDGRCLGLAFGEVRVFPSLPEARLFGEQIRLVGFELSGNAWQSVLKGGEKIYLALYWQAERKMGQDFTAFVHLVDEGGHIIAQDDQLLLDRAGRPTSAWAESEGVRTLHELSAPPAEAPGRYRLKVGLYELATMERLPLAGDESGENALILAVPEIPGSVSIRSSPPCPE